MPDLPSAAPSKPVVLPPLDQQTGPRVATGDSRMTLMAPAGAQESDRVDWAVVTGIALIAEIGLLWGAACVGLWRRRLALRRAMSGQ